MTPCAPLLSLLLATAAWAAPAVPFRTEAVPGGFAQVLLPPGATAPQVRYRGERVLVRRAGQGWLALVGLPLSATPGPATLEADGRSVPFTIQPKRYPEQHLTLKNLRQVNPQPEDEARIAREQALLAPQWQAWPAGLTPTLRFQQPTPGRLTASFGLRRFFNNEPRNPHPGLDIAAPKGRAVGAPAAGVVLLTGDFFFSGNTVLIGHGEGVVSLLCHLTDVTVQAGQALEPGQLVGHVGSTGRATGPHLHWTLSFNNARVDPGLALQAPRP
jgi:murein DD-endopeptidase MepM/ murein hydrolase activator NlpD